MNRKLSAILLSALFLVIQSCTFQKLLKHGTVDEKYEKALKLYEARDYARAIQLFDQVAGSIRATEKAQRIAYLYPFSYYYMGDNTLAAYYFKRYSGSYPNTPEAEECMYMSAYCNFLNSPEYSLDQTTTYEALKELQLFVNTYPKSKRVSDCNDLMDQLRFKLEMKDYKIAKLYYKMEDYTAAIQCLNNINKDYPDSPHREEVMFLIIKSYFRFAKESIADKQKERYLKTISSFGDFAASYPNSYYMPEALQMKEKSAKELAVLQTADPSKQRVKIEFN